MWYTLGHEKTHLYPSLDPGRTAVTPGGPAVVQCLCVTPLSALARQCPRPDRPRECRDPGLRRSDGPQCYSCLPYSRPGLPATPVLRAAADPACRLRCPAPRAVTRFLAPESAHLGHPTSQWTLALAAEMAYAEGRTHRPISGESIRRALACLGVRWKRAKHWITSPDPAYVRTKNGVTG